MGVRLYCFTLRYVCVCADIGVSRDPAHTYVGVIDTSFGFILRAPKLNHSILVLIGATKRKVVAIGLVSGHPRTQPEIRRSTGVSLYPGTRWDGYHTSCLIPPRPHHPKAVYSSGESPTHPLGQSAPAQQPSRCPVVSYLCT